MAFDIGDTVQLKSGGPIMTVGGETDRGKFECYWFHDAEPKWHTFKPEMLRPVTMPGSR